MSLIEQIKNNRVFYSFLVLQNLALATFIGGMSTEVLLSTLEDDFFYYFVIAKNLAQNGQLTFDGIHATNGFHPLWLMLITAIQYVLPSDIASLYTMKLISAMLPAVAMINMVVYLQGKFGTDRPDARIIFISLVYYFSCLSLSISGMEIALTLMIFPLFLNAIESNIVNNRHLFKLTILSMLVIFSRLDAALVIFPAWLIRMAQYSKHAIKARGVASIEHARLIPLLLLGWSPLILYVAFNVAVFGTLLPESAEAKALVVTSGPYPGPLNITNLPRFQLFALVWLVTFLLYIISQSPRSIIHSLLLIWPCLYFAALAYRSPWPLWPWYLYPIPPAVATGMAIILNDTSINTGVKRTATHTGYVLISIVYALLALAVAVSRPNYDIVQTAKNIALFAKTHPGTYAMGDRAGAVGLLSDQPVIQLEGLVGGRLVLAAINEQRDLLQFLQETDVDYYIATNIVEIKQGCYHAEEPAQGGTARKKMSSRFCASPVHEISTSNHGGTIKTSIFSVNHLQNLNN